MFGVIAIKRVTIKSDITYRNEVTNNPENIRLHVLP